MAQYAILRCRPFVGARGSWTIFSKAAGFRNVGGVVRLGFSLLNGYIDGRGGLLSRDLCCCEEVYLHI